jgi:hypothetical protein
MFKVICIANKKEKPGGHDAPQLTVGNEYTVIDVKEWLGFIGWKLVEVDATPPFTHFSPSYFAPLSDIDERDRLEAWQSERLTQEDKMLMALAENMPEEKLDPVAETRIWNYVSSHLNQPL